MLIVLWGAIWFYQSIHPSTKSGELPNHNAKSMEIYDLFDCSFILHEVERKGDGIFLSSRLESIQVAYYSVTRLAAEPQETTYSLEGQPIITLSHQFNDDLLHPYPRMTHLTPF